MAVPEAAAALDASEFEGLMRAVAAPPSTRLAVAVSGGADSMALALLGGDWAQRHGAELTALTVDHGLRPDSAPEAAQVGRWLTARGLSHQILTRRGPPPRSNVQADLRAARYALLQAWCRDNGVSDVLLAHHREDQAETLLLRLARGSGVDGLSAMSALSVREGMRLLRPLLAVPKARLIATLQARHQAWIEDPANADRSHARVRMRALVPDLAAEGMTPARLAATAGRLERARAALDGATDALLRDIAGVEAAGYARVDPDGLRGAAEEIALRAIVRLTRWLGGNPQPPREERALRLYAEIMAGGPKTGRTIAGCRFLPREGALVVCREAAAISDEATARPGDRLLWDGRFRIVLAADAKTDKAFGIKALGNSGWRQVAAVHPELRDHPIPSPARPTLPALSDAEGIVAVPHLDFERPGQRPPLRIARVDFVGQRALFGL